MASRSLQKSVLLLLVVSLFAYALTACGGGVTNQPPRGTLAAKLVNFGPSDIQGATGIRVEYTLNFYDPDGGTVNAVLFFGDGSSQTFTGNSTTNIQTSDPHPYLAQGSFQPRLELHDDDGSPTLTVYVNNDPEFRIIVSNNLPVATINATPSAGPVPLVVNFDGSASYDPDNPNPHFPGQGIILFEWNFNYPGNPAAFITDQTGAIAQHRYDTAGTYTAALRVTDNEGDKSIATVTINAGVNPPPNAIATVTPTSGPVPLTVAYDGSQSYDPDNGAIPGLGITLWEWDFDTTVASDCVGFAADTTGVTVSHTWTTFGTHVTALRVTDDDTPPFGPNKTCTTVTVTVLGNLAPIPIISANPTFSVVSPMTVSFNGASSYDPDGGNLISYVWDFNDGSPTAQGAIQAHTYTAVSGPNCSSVSPPVCTYNATLTVTDDDNQANSTQTTTQVIRIGGNPPPTAVLHATPTSGQTPLTVFFDASASFDPDTSNIISSYSWLPASAGGCSLPASSTAQFSCTFTTDGIYDISVTVTDNEQLTDTDTIQIIVGLNPPPVAVFSATPAAGDQPLTVVLDATGSYDPDGGTITKYEWDFGDGVPGFTPGSATLTHVYTCPVTVPCSFTATLQVTDDDFGAAGIRTGTASQTISVGFNPPPVAVINAPNTTCQLNATTNSCTLTFNGGNSYDPDNSNTPGDGISLYEWDNDFAGTIGSPGTGFASTPDATGSTTTFTYNAAGTHRVALRVTDDDAPLTGPRTTINEIVVTVFGNPAPVADISCKPTSGTAPFSVTCTGIGSHDPDQTNIITNYAWNIAGGNSNVAPTSFTGIVYTFTFNDDAVGAYTVTLSVTDDETRTDDEFAMINVGANPPPVAVATATPSFCTAPCNVTLDGSDSYDPDESNIITAYSWTVTGLAGTFTPFNSESSSFVVSFNSNAAGVYTTQLQVWDNDGLIDTVTVAIYINLNPPPVAVLNAPATSCMISGVSNECTLTFNGQKSYDPDEGMPPSDGQGITNYEWDPDGDGSFNGGLDGSTTITWTYGVADVGAVAVALRVTDNETPTALTNTTVMWVTILGNPPPVADVTCAPTSGIAPFSFTCTGIGSHDPDQTNILTNYSWTSTTVPNGSGTITLTPSSETGVVFTSAVTTSPADESGYIKVTLTVTDDEGLTDDESAIINVGPNPPPIAVATATPSFCTAPCNVTFDGSGSHDPDATNVIASYSWSVFGPDSNFEPSFSTASSFTVGFNSNASGVYTADLFITDDEGLFDFTTVSVYINLNPPPVAVINAPATTCMLYGTSNSCVLTFQGGNSYDPDNGMPPAPGQGITLYEWDADGDAAFDLTGQTITWTYKSAGPVPVTLRVTDDESPVALTDTETIWVTILSNPPPVAVIDAKPTTGFAPLTVTFNGGNSYDPDATNIINDCASPPLAGYSWDFGDSSVGTGALVTHTYVAAGTYTVTLTVTDDECQQDSEFAIITVDGNPPPVAVLTATPGFGVTPFAVTYDGSGSYDPDATNIISSYVWSSFIWDGCTSPAGTTTATFTCTYTAAGVYTVDLEVTDDEGLTDTTSITIFADVNPPPIAVINVPATTCQLSGPSNECTLTFNGGNSYDPDNGTTPGAGITLYEWDNDFSGSCGSVAADETGSTVTFTYTSAGTHAVTLRVTDDDSGVAGGPFTDCESVLVTVLSNPDPVASVKCTPTFGTAPFSFTCTGADSYDPDATNVITLYSWEICNGSGTSPPCTSTDTNPTSGTGIIFTAAFDSDASGPYTVNLEVTDDEGNQDTEQAILNAGANPPPIAVATATPSFCTAPCNITLDGSGSYDPDATNVIIKYQWGITGPDTNYSVPSGVTIAGGADACTALSDPATFTINFNSNAAGVYDAELRVCDDDSLEDLVTVSMFINLNPPPVAVLSVSANSCVLSGGGPSCSIVADGTESYDPDNGTNAGAGITDYSFDCDGDGIYDFTGTTPIRTCTYTTAGTKVLVLKVTDDEATPQTDTDSEFIEVLSNPPPVAVIESDRTHGGEPLTVAFTGLSSFDPDATNVITAYSWDFNDTGTGPEDPADCTDADSSAASPTHTFPEVGTYLVCLTVTDDEGLTNSAHLQIIVGGSNIPPVAVFTMVPVFGDAPLTITVDGTASYDPDNADPPAGIVCWEWDFNSDQDFTDGGEGPGCNNTQRTQTFTYPVGMEGNWVVTLRVTDDEGTTNLATQIVSVSVNPPPIADIQASPTVCQLSGPTPSCVIQFDACASDDPDNPGTNDGIVDFSWDFNSDGDFSDAGEGSTGTTCTNSNTYTVAGTYVATVKVTDDEGFTDTDTVFISVLSNPPPVAVIESDRTHGGEPLTVAFTGLSSFDPDATNVIAAYSWDFNDTGSGPEDPADCTDVDSTDASPTNTFDEVGTYLVCLTVTDDEGLTNTAHLQIIVGGSNIPPVAVFTMVPVFGDAPLTITVDGTASYDPDNADPPAGIVCWEWDFNSDQDFSDGGEGPGCNNTQRTQTFTYPVGMEGNWVVTLRVTDDEGTTNLATQIVSVGVNPPPIADIQASPTLGYQPPGLTVTFNGCNSDDPDDPGTNDGITNWEWDFNSDGDFTDAAGVEWTGPSEGSSAPSCTQTITYVVAGTYVATLRVTDGEGFTDTDTVFITVLANPPPVAVIDATPTSGLSPLTVQFSGINSFDPDPTNILTNYSWDFGDDTFGTCGALDVDATGVLVTHTFTSNTPATFNVLLEVTDDEGLTDCESAVISVNGNPPPVAIINATPTWCATAPCDINLDGTASHDPDATNVILNYQWGIAGGLTSDYVVPASVTSGGGADTCGASPVDPASFVIHFNAGATGIYTAELRVCDDETLEDVTSTALYINVNPPPVAIFTCDITTGITPFTVTCNGQNSYDPDNGTSPGAGITSYQWDFTFSQFGAAGGGVDCTDPRLTKHPNLGGNCTGGSELAVESPTGDFNTTPNATGDMEGAKDGAIATFTYPDSGVYIIALRVLDDDDHDSVTSGVQPAEDFEILTLTARDQPPSATIDPSPIACPAGPGVPCTFTLRANNSKDPDSATGPLPLYEWDFDYPNPLASNDPNHATNIDFCYRQGTSFVVDAIGTQVQFQTELHGIHIVALRVTDNDDQPWANDADDDTTTTVVGPTDLGEDNHGCASVMLLVKNPDFPPTVKVDIPRSYINDGPNAPFPEGTDNGPAGFDATDQAIPNDDEFLSNPDPDGAGGDPPCIGVNFNAPGCVELALWIEKPQSAGGLFTVGIDWDADGDDSTQNYEWAECTTVPSGLAGMVVASSNLANGDTCGPHSLLGPDVTFAAGPPYSFLGSDGVLYNGPPQNIYTSSGRHHIKVLVCDSLNPNQPLANCSEGDKTIESLKLHPAVMVNYSMDNNCGDFISNAASQSMDSGCTVLYEVYWNDPDGPALGTDCPTCRVQVDFDFGDSSAQGGNNNGVLNWPQHLAPYDIGDFNADCDLAQTGETDHIESDCSFTYSNFNRSTYLVAVRFLDDDSPDANIATASTTVVVRSSPPTIEVVHSEDDFNFEPNPPDPRTADYDPNDDLVGNPNTLWAFRICVDDSDDGAPSDAYGPAGGGTDGSMSKWIFVNWDAQPGGNEIGLPNMNDTLGSPFGYGDDDALFGPGFDFVSLTNPPPDNGCVQFSLGGGFKRQGRYVIHVRAIDDECHLVNPDPALDCDADNDGTPEADNPAVNVNTNAADVWLTLIVVDEPPVIWADVNSNFGDGIQPLTNNAFTLHFDAVDPDGGNVRVYINLDSNTVNDTDPNARADGTAHRVDQYSAGTDPVNPATCVNELTANGYPPNWEANVLDITPGVSDNFGPFIYSVVGRHCVRLMALDDEESALTLADPVANPPTHPSFATFMLIVVDVPPAVAVTVTDTDSTSNYGNNTLTDAVGVIGTTFTFHVTADDPDNLQLPLTDTVTVLCSPAGNVPAAVGLASDFADNVTTEDQWTLTPVLANIPANGKITCTFTYTDDEGNASDAKATILVVQSTPVLDVQVWDNNAVSTICDNAANASRQCRDAVTSAVLTPRFFTFYVRGEDPDNLQVAANDNLLVQCSTIDVDPGLGGIQPLNQSIVNPLFLTTSAFEGFLNTEQVDLDADTTVGGTQGFTPPQGGQHVCRVIYCDDEDALTCGDNYPAIVAGTPPDCTPDTGALSEGCALVTIVIEGNTLPTVLIDVRPMGTAEPGATGPAGDGSNPPAVFNPATHRRASSGFTDPQNFPPPGPLTPATWNAANLNPQTNRFVFRASAFDSDEAQDDNAPCPGLSCAFTFFWDLNNDGVFETATLDDNEVSVVYCDGFANGAAAGTNWSATAGNADPTGALVTCAPNSTVDQKLVKVGVCITDDEGQPATSCSTDTTPANGRSDRIDNNLGGMAFQTIALHDDVPWSEVDIDNAGGNDLFVPSGDPVVDVFVNSDDPDSPGETMRYRVWCENFGTGGGDTLIYDNLIVGGTTVTLHIDMGATGQNAALTDDLASCDFPDGSRVRIYMIGTDQELNGVGTAGTGANNPASAVIQISDGAGLGVGIETQVDATVNPLGGLNLCFAPCPVNLGIGWEGAVASGNLTSLTVDWDDGSAAEAAPTPPYPFVGTRSMAHTYTIPNPNPAEVAPPTTVYNIRSTAVHSGVSSTATTVLLVLDRAPSADIDILDLGGPAGSPGPFSEPRDNANALFILPGGSVTLTADRNAAGTALDDDTFDYEYDPVALTPADVTTDFQFNWWCDVNGDGTAQPVELLSGTNLTSVTYGPFPVGAAVHRCTLRVGDDERGALNGYADGLYDQAFGLCGAEGTGVACPPNINAAPGFAWDNDLWSSEGEIYIVVNDQPPSAYILENADGQPAGNDGDPTPSLDDFSGVLGTTASGACTGVEPCYSVDFRIFGVDPEGQTIDRLVDCTDDGVFEQRPYDQVVTLFDGNATCSYTAAGKFRIRVRNITDVNDSDPTSGAQGDALVTVVILDNPPTAYIGEAPGADGPPPGNDGDPTDFFDDWTGTVPPNYTVDYRAVGVDGDLTIGGVGVDRLVDCDGDAGLGFAFVRISDNAAGEFTDSTCVYSTVGNYRILLRVLSDPLDTDPAPPATSALCDASNTCADAFGRVIIFNFLPNASIETPGDDATVLFGTPPLDVPLEDSGHVFDFDGGNVTCRWDCNNDGTFEFSGAGASCPDLNGGNPGDVTCSYTTAGVYIARQVVEDDEFTAGDLTSRSTATTTIVVFDKSPSADIDEETGITVLNKAENWNNPLWLYVTGGPGTPITLAGMGADEGAGAFNLTYCTWDAPGSTTPVDATPDELCSFQIPDFEPFEYTATGTYYVTVNVEDDEDNDLNTQGNISQSRYQVVVYDFDPTISVKSSDMSEEIPPPPIGPCLDGDDPNPEELVNGFNGFGGTPFDAFCFFTDNLSSPDGDPVLNVDWDFDWTDALSGGGDNDGTLELELTSTTGDFADPPDASGDNVGFTYAAVGQYRVAARATDSTGRVSFAHLTVEVNDLQSDGKPSDPYVNVNCQRTPPVDPVVPLPFPPCPADDPTCLSSPPTLVDLTPGVFTCDAFADDPDDRTLGHQDPNGPDLTGSPHQSEEDGDPAGPDIVQYCWYIWKITDAKEKPISPTPAFDPHQQPIADCDNQIVPDLDDLGTRTPVLRFTTPGAYYMEAHVFDEGSLTAPGIDADNWCELGQPAGFSPPVCVDGVCNSEGNAPAEQNCAIGSITVFVAEARPAAAKHKLDPSYGWPSGTSGFTVDFRGASACLPPVIPDARIAFDWSFGDGAFFNDDNPPYVCGATPLEEIHSNDVFHTYVSPGQFYVLLSVRDISAHNAESQATSTVVGTDWPLFP